MSRVVEILTKAVEILSKELKLSVHKNKFFIDVFAQKLALPFHKHLRKIQTNTQYCSLGLIFWFLDLYIHNMFVNF